jgi:hypothetical protein
MNDIQHRMSKEDLDGVPSSLPPWPEPVRARSVAMSVEQRQEACTVRTVICA